MKLIIPQKLKPSSTVAFVSIAGEITNNESIDRAEKYFKNRGFLVKKYLGFLDGSHKSSLTAYMNSSITPSKAAAVFNQVEAKAMSTDENTISELAAKLTLELTDGEDSGGDVREGIEFTLTANNVTEPSNLKNLKFTVLNGADQDISNMFTIRACAQEYIKLYNKILRIHNN